MLSLVVTNYNKGKLLERCVKSIIDEVIADSDLELIIVDDNSNDAQSQTTYEILRKKYHNNRIKFIKNDINRGAAATKNIGIKESKHMNIYLIDADDFVTQDSINELKNFIKQKNSDLIFTDYIKNGSPQSLAFYFTKSGNLRKWMAVLKWKFLGASIYKREAFESYGFFDERNPKSDDFELQRSWINQGCSVSYFPKKIYNWEPQTFGNQASQSLEERFSGYKRSAAFDKENFYIVYITRMMLYRCKLWIRN